MASPAHLDSTVFIGDLDKNICETKLFEIFSKFGHIGSVRVCRDPVSNQSLGYGYVNYVPIPGEDPVSKAVEELSYTKLHSSPIRVMAAQSTKQIIKNGVGNVYIKGLPEDVDSRTLHDTFEVFGVVLSVKVVCNEEGKSLGYGYVQYRDVASAQQAVKRANGMLLSGSQLVVAHHVRKSARKSASAGFTNVYTRNLPKHVVTDNDLTDLYKEYGEITSACLLKAPEGKQGHGFVNFKDQDAAKKAVEKMNGRMFDEVAIFAAPAQKKLARQKVLHERYQSMRKEIWSNTKDRNLYVKNLDPCYDNEAFKLLFASFGTITSSKVMYDSEGKSRGFGFVCFGQAVDAQRAIKELHGQTVAGRRLYVALALPKEIRKAHLEQAAYNHNFYPRMPIVEAPGNGKYMPGPSNFLMPTPFQTSIPVGTPPPMIPAVHMPPCPIPFPFLSQPHMMPSLTGPIPGPAGQMQGPMGPLPNPMALMHSPLGPISRPMDLPPTHMPHVQSPMGPSPHPLLPFPHPMGPAPHPMGPVPHPLVPSSHPVGPAPHPLVPSSHPMGLISGPMGPLPMGPVSYPLVPSSHSMGPVFHPIGPVPHPLVPSSHPMGLIPGPMGPLPMGLVSHPLLPSSHFMGPGFHPIEPVPHPLVPSSHPMGLIPGPKGLLPMEPVSHPLVPSTLSMGPIPHTMGPVPHPLVPSSHPVEPVLHPMGPIPHPLVPSSHPMGLIPRPIGPLPMNLPSGHGSNNSPHKAPLAPSQTVETQNTGQKREKGFIGMGGRRGKGFGRGRPYWGGRGNRSLNNTSQRGSHANNTRQQPLHMPATGPQVTQVNEVPANLRALCNATPPEQRKTMLGECLYAKIRMHSSEKAAKITGMLLELEDDEVLGLLENGKHLKERVDDAIEVLFTILEPKSIPSCDQSSSNRKWENWQAFFIQPQGLRVDKTLKHLKKE